MRRAVAILLGFVLATASGTVSSLHIHAYIDHEHPEHEHGFAAHEHDRPAQDHQDDGDTVHVEPCDPGEHVLALTMACAPLPPAHAIDAVCPSLVLDRMLAPIRSVNEVTDVRVHGPPPLRQAPPRAPPLILPA